MSISSTDTEAVKCIEYRLGSSTIFCSVVVATDFTSLCLFYICKLERITKALSEVCCENHDLILYQC